MDDVRMAPTRHRLDVDDYHRMGEAGILGEDDRVELIDGELIDMAPIGENHIGIVNRLNRVLVMACGERGIVSVQNPVRLDRFNEPQPNFVVFRPRDDWYMTGSFPSAGDALLVVEVADSSLRYDRTVKLPLYARLGVAELWIVDLRRRMLEAYTGPLADGYARVRTLGASDRVTLSLAPEIEVSPAAVLG